MLPWKWAPLEPQTGQKSFIPSCLRWWCRRARKPGRAKAWEGEELPDSPPTNYGIHPKLESIQIIVANNRILPTEPSSMGKGEQIKRGIQGTRPKADSASELKRPTSRTIWASVPLGFSKVVQGQVGTVTHIYLNQKTSQETQDQNTRGPDSTTSE